LGAIDVTILRAAALDARELRSLLPWHLDLMQLSCLDRHAIHAQGRRLGLRGGLGRGGHGRRGDAERPAK
jgi:hypothetical protein